MHSPNPETQRLRDEVACSEERCARTEQAYARLSGQIQFEIQNELPRLMEAYDHEYEYLQETKQRLADAERQSNLNPAPTVTPSPITPCPTANIADRSIPQSPYSPRVPASDTPTAPTAGDMRSTRAPRRANMSANTAGKNIRPSARSLPVHASATRLARTKGTTSRHSDSNRSTCSQGRQRNRGLNRLLWHLPPPSKCFAPWPSAAVLIRPSSPTFKPVPDRSTSRSRPPNSAGSVRRVGRSC